ncbi:MAG: response regulator [Elusimicrobia bacterium]|jgi:CheY-like chemotaxis protein|nr:response regulator [Elusimicrobiota bacterium]
MGDAKKRLLIVEDDPNLMDLMVDFCDEISVVPIPAVDGASALTQAVSEMPDAVTVDYRLPDMSGLDVISRLKADPRVAKIPLILLSADAKIHETEAKALGAFGVLLKPVTPESVRSMLVACLGEW